VAGRRTLRFEQWHRPPRSLLWRDEGIVDLVGGGAYVSLDGAAQRPTVNWAFAFDMALASPSGQLQVLYTVAGTKGIVTTTSTVVREINRSFYCASGYEYPVAIGRLSDGTEVLAHCPAAYNKLMLERLVDGTPVVPSPAEATDVFQSRLRFSPSGRYLLSAGWVWHPVGVVRLYDITVALGDPAHLGGEGVLPWSAVDGDVEAACWLTDDRLAVYVNPAKEAFDGEGDSLHPGELGVWSIEQEQWVSRVPMGQQHMGTMHEFGGNLLSLYEHPRLVEVATGTVTKEWPDLSTGRQLGSILPKEPVPPVAVDSEHLRFAVLDGEEVIVIEVDG
jgi:hypothetical protein